jgi:hypothetical protein
MCKMEPVAHCALGLYDPLYHNENATFDRQGARDKTYMIQILL